MSNLRRYTETRTDIDETKDFVWDERNEIIKQNHPQKARNTQNQEKVRYTKTKTRLQNMSSNKTVGNDCEVSGEISREQKSVIN